MRQDRQPNLIRSVVSRSVACSTQHRPEGRRGRRAAEDFRLHPMSGHSGRDEDRRCTSSRFAREPGAGGGWPLHAPPAQEPRGHQAAFALSAGPKAAARTPQSTPTDPSTILETAHAG